MSEQGFRLWDNRWVVLVLVILVCSVLLTAVYFYHPQPDIHAEGSTDVTGLPISIQIVSPQAHAARVTALGEVLPLWETTMNAQVAGRIEYLSPRLRAGQRVQRGERLVEIAKSNYALQIAEAQGRLANAQVNVLRAEREVFNAQRNWTQSGMEGPPDSALVLHQPQLKAAQAELDAAQALLTHAQTLWDYTTIRAPYDGLVVTRDVDPCETLFAGGLVATVYSLERAEIAMHLDAEHWALLPEDLSTAQVQVVDPDQGHRWSAHIVRESHRRDRLSRLRTLYLHVERPLEQMPPLLPGTFVRMECVGRSLDNLLCVPETALTKQGIVWLVDPDDRLLAYFTEPTFYGDGVVYIVAPQDLDSPYRVAVSPNSSFVTGLAVYVLHETEEGD